MNLVTINSFNPMLHVRSAYLFRKWYKRYAARNEDNSVDISFVDVLHPDTDRMEKGFSNLVFGNRKSLGSFFRSSLLNVAADQQAIYELIQNADDSEATLFSVNYNENYLLCINNGRYFSDENMAAIINVGDSDKHGDDIGTFGIGFKILHRLLGEDDGHDAIIHEYAGPILFSWNRLEQFEQFVSAGDIIVDKEQQPNNDHPWLVKIIYTCFPSDLDEQVRLRDYETQRILFTQTDLAEMRQMLNASLANIDLQQKDEFQNGSIFFLKLGPGKYRFIAENIEKLKSGISYSFNFLHHLHKIYINGQEIKKQHLAGNFERHFKKGSEEFSRINPRNRDRDIKVRIIYYSNYKDSIKLKDSPSIYNFFSMDEERNGFRFLLHCNAFDMHNDRRKLQPDSQINERLLPEIAKAFLIDLDQNRKSDLSNFLTVYANLLLTPEPSKQNIKEFFFPRIKKYLLENIPTINDFSNNSLNTKIKGFKVEVNLNEIGLEKFQWFYWMSKDDELLLKAAEEVLSIKKWDIRDLVKAAELSKLNGWIHRLSFAEYEILFNDIGNDPISMDAAGKFAQVQLFKFSDGNHYSVQDTGTNKALIFTTFKNVKIKEELISLGFIVSELDLSKLPMARNIIEILPKDKDFFQMISAKTAAPNALSAAQKKKLFKNFIELDTRWVDIEVDLKKLKLFTDRSGQTKSLNELLQATIVTPIWLDKYKIVEDEYDVQFDNYLISDRQIYASLILPNWASIIKEVDDLASFYDFVLENYKKDENNPGLTNQQFIYVRELNGNGYFFPKSLVFYNQNLASINSYASLQEAILALTKKQIPLNKFLKYYQNLPFKIDNADFCDLNGESAVLDEPEVTALIQFCIANKENFFQHYTISKTELRYTLSPKANNTFQVYADRATMKFIEDKLQGSPANTRVELIPLPGPFSNFKDERGVFSREDCYNLIVEYIDVGYYLEDLTDLISYTEPKRAFLLKLGTVVLPTEKIFTTDSIEFKIIKMACEVLNEDLQRQFRNKIFIEVDGIRQAISRITTSSFGLEIDGLTQKFSLEKMLPENFQHSDHLNAIIAKFIELGIRKHELTKLFGLNKEIDLKELINQIPHELKNAHQLAFVIAYHWLNEQFNLDNYLVKSIGECYSLAKFDFYTRAYPFLVSDATLGEQFTGTEEMFNSFPVKISTTTNNELLIAPYFSKLGFICPDLDNSPDDGQRISLFEFIFKHWKGEDKEVIKQLDWSSINGEEALKIFGFNPVSMIFPTEFALREEELPPYFLEWVKSDDEKIDFLADLKINTECSFVISLRRYLKENTEFESSRIAQEGSKTLLTNSLKWMKDNQLQLCDKAALDVFKELVRVINLKRKEAQEKELCLQDEFDPQQLSANCVEWDHQHYLLWKAALDNKFHIYIYPGKLPKTIRLDEVENHLFFQYHEGDFHFSEENEIYVNSQEEGAMERLLSLLVEKGKMDANELLLLYQKKEEVKDKKDFLVGEEEFKLLNRMKENGSIDNWMEALDPTASIPGKNALDLLRLGSQAFQNDGAMINSGALGEKIVYHDLIQRFGKPRVKWTSSENIANKAGSGTDEYDFEIYDTSLQHIIAFVDVKSTTSKKYQSDKTEIFWRNSEWEFLEGLTNSTYLVARVFDVNSSAPEIIYLQIVRASNIG